MKKIFFIITMIVSLFIFNMQLQALEDGVYVIHSSINDNYVLDVNRGNSSNGANIQLWQNNNMINQKFFIKKNSDGTYNISSALNESYSLDINAGKFVNSTNIQLWKNNNLSSQKWIIKETNDGYYTLSSINDNYVIDVDKASASNKSNVQLWTKNNTFAQKFRLEKLFLPEKTIEDGVYTISWGINNNKKIDIYKENFSNATNVNLWDKNSSSGQKFYINYIGSGFYNIRSYSDMEYSLDVHAAGTTNQTNIELYKYNNTRNQQWIIKDTGDGYYNIISRCNYLAIDGYAEQDKNGTNIQSYKLKNTKGQQFKFEKETLVGSRTLSNGYYYINSIKNKNIVFDIKQGLIKENQDVEIFKLHYGLNQKWYIDYSNNGYYKIISNMDGNYCLHSFNNNISIGKCSNNENQQWIIKKVNKGYYIISKNGKYINLNNNNINIMTSDFSGSNYQKFNFTKTAEGLSERTLSDGIYRISSTLNSNMFVDVKGGNKNNGTNIQLWQSNASSAQKFYISYLSNGYYKISPLVDIEKSLDNAYTLNNNAIIFSSSSTINQQFIIKDAGNGNFNIISNYAGLYLDVANSNISNGTNISFYEKNGAKNQLWKFKKSERETKVIDVSAHQNSIDWNKVNKTGIYGVILRVGFWNQEDAKFSEYINEVKRLGLPYGIYLFSYANTTDHAVTEANFMNQMIAKYDLNPSLGFYYDIETWRSANGTSSTSITKDGYDAIISTFINRVSPNARGYKVKVYANLNFANNRFNSYARNQIDWIAQYNSTCTYTGKYSLWQYTSSATLDGINGNVDMSYLY